MFSIAQLGVLREQHTDRCKATCNTTWVERLLQYLTCKCNVHRVERSSGGGDTDILLKFIFVFLSHTMGKSPIPSRRVWKFLQTTQQINPLTLFELNGVSFGLLLSLALGV